MSIKTIECSALLSSGDRCSEMAIVHDIRFQYERVVSAEGQPDQYVRKGTVYEVTCPRCGRRKQFEWA
jgi:hypothetical protein